MQKVVMVRSQENPYLTTEDARNAENRALSL
jgi:hypothetical protein